MARVSTGRLREARREFAKARRRWAASAKDEDPRLALDRHVVRALMMVHAQYEWQGSEGGRALVADAERIAEMSDIDPVRRGIAEYGMCFFCNQTADFDAALWWGERAKGRFGGRAPFMQMLLEFQLGQIAVAQGRVEDATHCYRLARGMATEQFLRQPRLRLNGEMLAGELDLERYQFGEYREPRRVSMEVYRRCPQLSVYAAASVIAVELTLEADGVDAALDTVQAMQEHAEDTDLPMLLRFLSALRVSVLVEAERVREAEWAWRDAGLPSHSSACLDLRGQSRWEMEALACARLRVLVAKGDIAAGRRFADALVGIASGRGLRRTEMRALALAIALEERSGRRGAALDRFREFLRLFAETDYARPLVQYRDTVTVLGQTVLQNRQEAALRPTVLALLQATRKHTGAGVPRLSPREREVVERLEASDAEIGTALGLTADGVRYHVKKIFRKFEAKNRRDARRRARELGILPKGAR